MLPVLAGVLLAGGGAAEATAAPPEAFFAERIWTGNGSPIDDGVLVVRDGKILAVGARGTVRLPDDVVRHELGRTVLIPGLVVAETALTEGRGNTPNTLTPEVRAVDGFNPFADQSRNLAGGVTTVGLVPSDNRLISGQGAVVKLAGDDAASRILSESESLRIVLSEASRNPPRLYEPPVGAVSVERPLQPAAPQLAATLGGAVAGLRAVFRAAQESPAAASADREPENDPDGPSADADGQYWLSAVTACLAGKQTVRITAVEPAEIRAALSLGREFRLQVLLVDPRNLDPFLGRIGDWSATLRGVVLNAGLRPGQITDPPLPDEEQPVPRQPWEQARDLLRAGVKVALRPSADADLSEMLFLGGLFTRGDIPPAQVLRMITSAPAELLGVSHRVGSLAAGKDADFAVLSGDPFADRTRVVATYVNGRRVSEQIDQPAVTVISAAAIYSGRGQVLEGGSLVVQGTKIRDLGRDVSAPLDAMSRRYKNAVIVPGFIDMATGLGVGAAISENVALDTKLGDQLFSGDRAVEFARRGGVTTVLLASTASSPSPVVAFKLADKLRVLKDPVALRFSVSGNLTAQAGSLRRTLAQGKSYFDAWNRFDAQQAEYEKQLKEYESAVAKAEAAKKEAEAKKQAEAKKEAGTTAAGEKPAAGDDPASKKTTEPKADPAGSKESKPAADGQPPGAEGEKKPDEAARKPDEKAEPPPAAAAPALPAKPTPPTRPQTVAALEPYRELFAGKIPAMVEARKSNALSEAVKIFRDEFSLRTIILGADDVVRVPELVANRQVAVAAGPVLLHMVDQRFDNLPQTLANHQVPFGFLSQATTGVQALPLAVQFAVSKGLSRDDALRGLTSAPAGMLMLDPHVGAIEVGKDADLVVLSGPPFEIATHVLAVMIDGQWVYEKEESR